MVRSRSRSRSRSPMQIVGSRRKKKVCEAWGFYMNRRMCFDNGGKWSKGMCHYHARQMGCQPPERKLCKVCVAVAKGKDKDSVCGELPTRARQAHTHGMCQQHARLAEMSDDDKIRHVRTTMMTYKDGVACLGFWGVVMEDDE